MPARPATLLLSFDLEDYEQLVHRHLGLEGWDAPTEAFERQAEAIFELLDEVGAKATFFCLGMTARHHPDVIREILRRGDEVACHGLDHVRVYDQTRDEFRRDVETCAELLEGLSGRRPAGYRAPAFSINRATPWAFEVLAELGFEYDSSLYDSAKVPDRLAPAADHAYRVELPDGRELIEFPVSVWRRGARALPIGGGSYWRVLPAAVLRRGLRSAGERSDYAPLYFHPYEFDPRRLRSNLPPSASTRQRAVAAYHDLRNGPGRRRLAARIRRLAADHDFTTHERALADIRDTGGEDGRARPAPL